LVDEADRLASAGGSVCQLGLTVRLGFGFVYRREVSGSVPVAALFEMVLSGPSGKRGGGAVGAAT
jgi:hypothetical protein